MLWFILTLMTGCAGKQLTSAVPEDDVVQSIERAALRAMAREELESVSVALIRDGRVVSVETYGQASDDTVYEFASLGKPVFAYLALMLAEEGLYDLDQPLTRYSPALFTSDDPRLRTITARMVLSHTSGLPNYGAADLEALAFEPGREFQYSGIGLALLQTVLEDLTAQPLDSLATERLFGPLGMMSTSYVWREDYSERLAQGYDADGEPKLREPTTTAHAAWSLYSTAADYAAFVAFFLQQSAQGEAIPRWMVASEIEITPEIAWGLGWGLQTTTPGPSFWHWGSNPGYRSFVVGYPEEQLAVVVCSNSEALFKQVDTIIRSAIGGALPAYDWF